MNRILKQIYFVKNRQRVIIFALPFILVGLITLIFSSASPLTSSLQPEGGSMNGLAQSFPDITASGGSAIQFKASSTVRRFFSSDASWNKTITQLGGEITELKPFAYRLWDYGGGTSSGSPPGNFYLNLKDYSVPIYDLTKATTTAKVFQVGWAASQQALSFTGINVGTTIPWNPDWKPGTGNDRIMASVDYATGKVYEFWGVGENPLGCIDVFGPNAQNGYDPNNPNHLCIAGINTYDNLWTAKDGSTIIGRGMGINKLALVVRAAEVETGDIGHAIPLTTSNPMFGAGLDTPGVIAPTATTNGSDPLGLGMVNPKYDALQPQAGFQKGFYLKPATRLEHEFGYIGKTLSFGGVTTTQPTDTERAKTNPSGMHFALNITYNEIDSWVESKTNWSAEKKKTARTLARAWKDYGAIIAETGGYGIGIETDGIIDPASKATWAKLGIVDDTAGQPQPLSSSDIFSGLITRDRLYVVKPPQ